jgi:CheY-like chemotaxis protein
VRELLLNIVKHAGTDRARLRMTRSRGRVRLEVSDEGSGFDPSELEVSQTFGLFHLRERLVPIGGRMTIKSAPGAGTRITISAPHDLQATAGSAGADAAHPGDERRNGNSKTRILLVDDHRIIREGLIALLEREPDLDVIGEAGDGQTAVEITRDLEPDVVIMDVNMPGVNGIAATQHITVAMPHVRVIGLSLHGEDAMGQAMIHAGAAAYLTKGGPSHELIETIREVAARNG